MEIKNEWVTIQVTLGKDDIEALQKVTECGTTNLGEDFDFSLVGICEHILQQAKLKKESEGVA